MEAAPGKGANAVSQSAECFSCYMTQKGQSRNVLASPLGEEGHEVAKGCTRVRMIMILDVDVTAEGGIIKLIARRAIHHPLNQPAKGRPNPLNLLNPHTAGVSNGAANT